MTRLWSCSQQEKRVLDQMIEQANRDENSLLHTAANENGWYRSECVEAATRLLDLIRQRRGEIGPQGWHQIFSKGMKVTGRGGNVHDC